MTRRVGRTLLALLLLLVVVIGLCEWAGWPFLKGPIERAASNALGRKVFLGEDFRLRVLGSIRVSSDVVKIEAAEGAPVPETDSLPEGGFLHATEPRVQVPYSTVIALIRGPEQNEPLTVTALEVDRLDLALARTKDGKANWEFGDPAEQDSPEPAGSVPPIPRFERLVVRDGHVVLDDEVLDLQLDAAIRTSEFGGDPDSANSEAAVATGGKAAAPGGAPAPTADSAAATEGAGQATQGLQVDATGSYRGDELEAHFRTTGVLPLIAATTGGAQPLPMKIDLRLGKTELALEGQASDLLQLNDLEGSYRLEGASLATVGGHAGLTLPGTGPFEIHGTASKHGEIYATKIEGLTVGSSRLAGEFEFDPTREVPRLRGVLSGKRLALADLAPAFGAATEEEDDKKKKKEKDTGGRVLPQDEFNIPSLANMEADVEFKLDSADLGTDLLRDFRPLNAHVTLKDQVLRVDRLLARTADGELSGAVSLDARKETPIWNADLQWAGIRLERFITARNTRNTKQRDSTDGKGPPGYVTGIFGGRTKLQGAGNSTARMLGSLDGSTDLWVTDGTISQLVLEVMGIDVAQALGLAVSGDQNLVMNCAVTRLEAKAGVIRTEAAIIDTTDTTIMVDGEVSLAKERLDLVLSARPKDFSPVALRAPVNIEGTFADPEIMPDTGTIGLRIAGAAVLAAINPLASLIALFDTGDPNTAACAKALQASEAPPGEGTAKGGTSPSGARPGAKKERALESKKAPGAAKDDEITPAGVGER